MSHVFAFDHRHERSPAAMAALLGGKGANLADMTTGMGLPVPAGFTITTEACNEYLEQGWPRALDDQIEEHVAQLESSSGKRFGDSADPLLVSVRSGAPVSMPGMMDTILNLGLNADTVVGLGETSGDDSFASDCHDRFLEMFRSTTGDHHVPDDPWEQLRGAIGAVFRSWHSDRAKTYRRREGIAHDLGTAVNVQTMVFGNRGEDSATGVMFTRDPATGADEIYGDLLFNAQGEDVVAGTHQTMPLTALDERLPSVGAELRGAAEALERRHRDLCDIEFTVEEGRLWLLQVRVGKRSPQAALRIALDMAQDPDFPLSRPEAVQRVARHLEDPPVTPVSAPDDEDELTIGLPASPGVAVGEIVTSPDAAMAAADSGHDVILVRSQTSPADVHGMAAAVGILTAAGGLASHAAVVARGWGLPAVVGAAEVEVGDDSIVVSGATLAVGDVITIDGTTGKVFRGDVGGGVEIVPEAVTLQAWATQLGIEVHRRDDHDQAATAGDASRVVTADELIATMAIKGLVTPDSLAPALLSTPDEVSPLCDRLVADGLIGAAGPMFRLTDSGTVRADELTATDRTAWGLDAAQAALDDFVAIDRRMKLIITRWQLKDVSGEPVPNDHSDAAYDEAVLADLAELHDDASDWLARRGSELARLGIYHDRLNRALGSVLDGDHRFIASPMVDSYHTVWFELHEDLIRLAGRTRAEETAAGRA